MSPTVTILTNPLIMGETYFSVFLVLSSLVIYGLYKAFAAYRSKLPLKDFPIVTVRDLPPKDAWIDHGQECLEKGLTEHDTPFQVISGTGPITILKSRYAAQLRDKFEHSLDPSVTFKADFFPSYHGFQGIAFGINPETGLIGRTMIQRKLTPSLNHITNALTDEATQAIADILGGDVEWHTVNLVPMVQKVIARVSSRIFLGEPLCRDERLLEIEIGYTVHTFLAAGEMRRCSSTILRRFWSQYKLPNVKALRKDYGDMQDLVAKELERREIAAKKAYAEGKKAPKYSDAVAWLIETAEERGFEMSRISGLMVDFQLWLSLAAIHTTTMALTIALCHLCENQEFVEPLRREIIDVLGDKGWSRSSLHQMKFLDSYMKESQRYWSSRANMRRMVVKDIHLDDGIKIPKGTRIQCEMPGFDADLYPEPYKFNPYRFMQKGQEGEGGQDLKWHYVSCTPEFFGFGLGLRACLGRFFAANELKVLFAHLLLKYDWDFDPEAGRPPVLENESVKSIRPDAKLRCRRRKEEVDLERVQL